MSNFHTLRNVGGRPRGPTNRGGRPRVSNRGRGQILNILPNVPPTRGRSRLNTPRNRPTRPTRPTRPVRPRGRPPILDRPQVNNPPEVNNPFIVHNPANNPDEPMLPQRGRPPNPPAAARPAGRRTANSPTFLTLRNQNFNDDQFKFEFKSHQESMIALPCNTCNRKFYDVIVSPETNLCEYCSSHNDAARPNHFTAENHMDPGDQPAIFKLLTLVEEMLISQVFILIYKLFI